MSDSVLWNMRTDKDDLARMDFIAKHAKLRTRSQAVRTALIFTAEHIRQEQAKKRAARSKSPSA